MVECFAMRGTGRAREQALRHGYERSRRKDAQADGEAMRCRRPAEAAKVLVGV